jgi:hypothetical protein
MIYFLFYFHVKREMIYFETKEREKDKKKELMGVSCLETLSVDNGRTRFVVFLL